MFIRRLRETDLGAELSAMMAGRLSRVDEGMQMMADNFLPVHTSRLIRYNGCALIDTDLLDDM